MEDKKAIFIGPEHYCDVFALAGVRGEKAGNHEEAKKKIEEVRDDYDLVFVSQDVYKDNSSEGVVVVPGMKSEDDENYLQEEIKRAIGRNINI